MTPATFLINLDGSDARLATARAALEGLGLEWTRVAAVDGRGRAPTAFPEYDDAGARAYMGRAMTGAEVACHLSHAKALRAFLDGGAAHALVLEDDFHPTDGAAADLRPVLDWLGGPDAPPWQVVNLGAHKRKLSTRIARVAGRDILAAHYFPMLATAILWTRPAAARFVAASARMTCPSDNELRRWQTRTRGGLSVWPPLIAAGGHASDIDSRERRTDRTAREAGYGLAKQKRLWTDKAIATAALARVRTGGKPCT